MTSLFHLAFPVNDIEAARAFYGGVLGCPEGRSAERWVDFDLYGHQIVVHLAENCAGVKASNHVDADDVPVPHFGIVLQMEAWKELAESLKTKGVKFIIEPKVRFTGEPGEHGTMFFLDPSGNALEFKGFNDLSRVFAR